MLGIQDLEPDLWRLCAVFPPQSREMEMKRCGREKTMVPCAVDNGGEDVDFACAGAGNVLCVGREDREMQHTFRCKYHDATYKKEHIKYLSNSWVVSCD
jgi:hypothetical protein